MLIPHPLQYGGNILLGAFLVFFFSVSSAHAADMKLLVTEVAPELNLFSVSFSVETGQDSPLNAAQATVHIPESLELIDISFDTSLFDLWIFTPVFSPEINTIEFAGGTTRPGGFIFEGVVFTAIFAYTGDGIYEFNIDNALVLAHDGKGTNILDAAYGTVFNVQEEVPEYFDTDSDGTVSLSELSIGMTNEA